MSEQAIARLPSGTSQLTPGQREAVARWLGRPDVFAVLVEASPHDPRPAAEQTVAALEFELGEPSPANKALAEALVAEVLK